MEKFKYVGVKIFIEKKIDTYDKLSVLAEGLKELLFASSKIKMLVDFRGHMTNSNLYHQYRPFMSTIKFEELKKLSEKKIFQPDASTFPKGITHLYKCVSLREVKTANGRDMIELYVATTDKVHDNAIERTLIPVVNELFKNEVYNITVRNGADDKEFFDYKKYMI